MKKLIIVFLAIILSSVYAQQNPDVTFTLNNSEYKLHHNTDPQYWTATTGSTIYTLEKSESEYHFFKGEEHQAKAKLSNEKIKFKDNSGSFYIAVKYYPEKIKVSKYEEDKSPWQIKYYDNKQKLKRGSDTLAEIKYYADSQKIKIKSSTKRTLLELKGGNTVFPLPLLMDTIDKDRQVAVMLLLWSQGR